MTYDVSKFDFGDMLKSSLRGSPYIPAQQEFVQRFGIKSVVGFGGMLATGHLYAVILFAATRSTPPGALRRV